jgi:hypothetical protein
MKTYTYSDSEAGMQHESFSSLSGITNHIESFEYTQDSDGVIFQDGKSIIEYSSIESGIIWKATDPKGFRINER